MAGETVHDPESGDPERTLEDVVFRSILDRDSEDQQRAAALGYSSVAEWQVDELGKVVKDIVERLARLEAGAVVRMSGEDKDEIVERVVERLRG